MQALIAFTNRGEEKNLRKLEMRLLEHGVTVTRTADDLVRYHGKMFLIDRKELHLLAFNYTHLDITLSRSFAAVITDASLVAEAVKLFECDVHRTPFTSTNNELVVSPVNARKELCRLHRGREEAAAAVRDEDQRQRVCRAAAGKIRKGVEVRVIGRPAQKDIEAAHAHVLSFRLHARAILRDGKVSVSRQPEPAQAGTGGAPRDRRDLPRRRAAVKKMVGVFEKDWEAAKPLVTDSLESAMEIPVRRVAKIVARHIHMKPMVEQALERVLDRSSGDVPFEPGEVAQTVREAFREEIHDAVLLALRDMASQASQLAAAHRSRSLGGRACGCPDRTAPATAAHAV